MKLIKNNLQDILSEIPSTIFHNYRDLSLEFFEIMEHLIVLPMFKQSFKKADWEFKK